MTVCVQFLTKFQKRLSVNEVASQANEIEIELYKACSEARGKDERLVRDCHVANGLIIKKIFFVD